MVERGDIGSHVFHLACFVTRCTPTQILADLSTFVPGRRVDDNAHVLLRFPNGARGMLWASQVAHGQRTHCACASTANKVDSNGCRRNQTDSGSRHPTARGRC
jgi:predicted dehydrogenase